MWHSETWYSPPHLPVVACTAFACPSRRPTQHRHPLPFPTPPKVPQMQPPLLQERRRGLRAGLLGHHAQHRRAQPTGVIMCGRTGVECLCSGQVIPYGVLPIFLSVPLPPVPSLIPLTPNPQPSPPPPGEEEDVPGGLPEEQPGHQRRTGPTRGMNDTIKCGSMSPLSFF